MQKWIKNAIFSVPTPSHCTECPVSFRPHVEALEDRQLLSATTYSLVSGVGGSPTQAYEVVNKRLIENISDASGWKNDVPGCSQWNAWEVKAVRNSHNDVEVFVNSTDGHLWEITRLGNSKWSGWTDMNKNFRTFDVSDANVNGYVTVIGTDTLTDKPWVTTQLSNGHWLNYSQLTFNARDVAIAVDSRGQTQFFAVGLSDHHVYWGSPLSLTGVIGVSWKNEGGSFDHVNAWNGANNTKFEINAWKQGSSAYQQKIEYINGISTGWFLY